MPRLTKGSERPSKKAPDEGGETKGSYPTANVKLWCEDEHRLGTKPILRKVWSWWERGRW